jgi:endoglucanase
VKTFGYNTIRIPFSDQMVKGTKVPNQISFFGQNGPIDTDLQGLTSMQILDKIINYAGSLGLKVILDNHRSEDGNSTEQNGLRYTSAYPESVWVNDWVALANRYKGNATVVAMDLRNEPHTQSFSSYGTGSTWGTGNSATDWNLAAQKAGNAILAVNPSLLIAVEGISDWVNDSGVTVWVGEFGTPNGATDASDSTPGRQGQWFSGIVQYIKANSLSWTYWALNGEDAYGLVDNQYDATPVSAAKQSALATLQFPFGTPPSSPPPTSSTPGSPSASASPSATSSTGPAGTCSVSYVKQSEWPGGVVVQLAVTNTGTTAFNGWTLAFTFPDDQHITNSWSSTFQQTGASATLKDAGYNATIPPGGNVSFGFQGTWNSSDATPTSFTLNGAVCR